MGSDGWTLKRFNHCADLIRDTVRPSDVSGLPYIGLEHIAEGQLTLTGFGSAEQVTSIKSRFRKGDILFGKLRPYFRKVVIAPFDGVCSTDIWVVRQKQGIDQRYLFYWMASNEFIEESTRASEGTRMPRAQWEFVGRIEKSIPPLPEQRAIAHILGTLDDKIELNRRMNQTLEEMARAIFKSWFVDFDPVRAKAAVRREHPNWSNAQVSRAACPNLKPEIAELFPDEFENSELGEIPKGWRVAALPDVIEVNPTRVLRKGEVAPYLDMANMPTRCHTPDVVVERPFGSGMRFMNGDTLVARITPCLENGKTAYVDFLEDGQVGWGSTEYIVLRPKPPLPPEFGYCLARSVEFRDFAIQSMTGSSGRQRVAADSLAHFHLVVAPKPIAEKFGEAITPLLARGSKATAESRTLAALRDTLLPKLISGELRLPAAVRDRAAQAGVKDAEQFLNRRGIL